MGKAISCIFAFLLLGIMSQSVFAVTVNQQTICAGNMPTGWILADEAWIPTQCGNPTSIVYNVWTIYEYDNLPVGATLSVCNGTVPAGWAVTSTSWIPTRCGNPATSVQNVMTINHASCVNEATNLCYPPQPTTISASPTTVQIPYGQTDGSTTLSWNAPSYSSVCVWVSSPGGTTQLWSCTGSSNTQTWPYVPAGSSNTFIVSPSSSSPSPQLASVTVYGVADPAPKISASPTVVTVPAGQSSGSTTVSYDLTGSGYSSMCIWVQNSGGTAQVWSCSTGTTHSQVWPYVPKGGTSTFWLSTSQTSSTPQLASVTVTGQ